jgi:hypothetical protein
MQRLLDLVFVDTSLPATAPSVEFGQDNPSSVRPESTDAGSLRTRIALGVGIVVSAFHQQPRLVVAFADPGQRITPAQLLAVQPE